MAFRVFYAWQSDRPNNLCRALIRRALDQATDLIQTELAVDDAERTVEIDQDTQGVAGSPPIAETILKKIRECHAFVADLTFMPSSKDVKVTPNPNVLIEYGYAMGALSDQRIVGVFNEAFGAVADLPFDLQHRRWPIRYNAGDESEGVDAQQHRRAQCEALARRLEDAIGAIVRTFAQSDEPTPAPVSEMDAEAVQGTPTEETQGVHSPQSFPQVSSATTESAAEEFPWEKGVGIREHVAPQARGYHVQLLEGPELYLQLKPLATRSELSNVQTHEIASDALLPPGWRRAGGWNFARNGHGAVVFVGRDNSEVAYTASLLTRNGDLYAIDRYHLQGYKFKKNQETAYIPTGAVEEILIDVLENFLDVAENHVKLAPPLKITAGLKGIEGFRLAVDPVHFGADIVGHIFERTVTWVGNVDNYDCDAFDVLLPLFNKVYDCAGHQRPDVRTPVKPSGRRHIRSK